MFKNLLIRTCLAAVLVALPYSAFSQEKSPDRSPSMDKLWGKSVVKLRAEDAKRGQLFDEGNYAMFIHWGLYSQLGNKVDGKTYYGIGEWIMNPRMAGIPVEQYKQLAGKFNPVKFNASEIAKIARDAGMKYIVITAKHHDGFAMYDSKACDFNIVDATPWKKDPMKELAAACREAGLGFGFYYSHNQDWTFPGGGGGPKVDAEGKPATFDDYFAKKCLPQVKEITTEYGPIEIVWFDTPGNIPKHYVEKLVEVVHENQPHASPAVPGTAPGPSPRSGERGVGSKNHQNEDVVAKKSTKHASFTDADDALLAELGVEAEAKTVQTYTPKQERIIAGFEDIQRFHREYGRVPQHGEDRDIFERLYAVRRDRILADAECLELLRPLDEGGLLAERVVETDGDCEVSSDAELLEALGVSSAADDDITTMKHVRTAVERNAERNSPDEVAQRKPCEDFAKVRRDFEAVQADIESGRQTTELFKLSSRSKIAEGDWFIVDGQKALVAESGQWFTPEHGERDRRLRIIFDNGTESDLLMRSLRRALNKDENSRRIIPPQPETDEDYSDAGPLFSDQSEEDDLASGTTYVARSLSDDSFIQENREVLHKIGVTGGDPNTRIAGAKKDPTYLLADAELVATYKLANINRKALEATLHKFFAKARLDVALADRFGDMVRPREWFLVPLPVIAEVVDRIKDGSIANYFYDPETATLRERS
jgi:hypothetical protein